MGRISWSLAWLACALSLCLACGEQAPEGDTKGIVDVISETVTAPAGGCHTDADCPVNDNVCTPNRCLGDGSCVAKSALGPCDDGEPCTMSDTCVAGKCVGTDLCECRVTKDCAGLEDADACNGTLYCHTKTLPYRCRVNPTSVVSCKAAAGVCAESRCDPASGKCADEPAVDGTTCNDGDACTVESACKGGKCVGSTASWCQCEADGDCAKLGQGNACDGSYFCDKATFPYMCKVNPVSVVSCSDAKDTACAKNACSPKTGKCGSMAVEKLDKVCPTGQPCRWVVLADGVAGKAMTCDDGNACTQGDLCKDGSCSAGGTDLCKCTKNADCESQEDGDLCNGVLYCELSSGTCKVNPKTLVTCPTVDDKACIKNTCNAKTGTCALTPVKPGTACDDGDKCTKDELCVSGACAGGVNTCSCKSDSDCADQDDGNLCNGLLYCQKLSGKCIFNPASVVTCPSVDDTACVKNTCVAKTGTCQLANQATKTQCDDGDGCTANDHCDSGKCVGGTFVCGCGSDKDCLAKDDGDLCNGVPFCDKTAKPAICKPNPATVISCPSVDDTTCRKNTCVAKTGKCLMKPVDDGTACDDNNACTKSDFCGLGKCQGGANTCECQVNSDCAGKDDGNLCNGTWYCDKSGKAPKCAFNAASKVYCSKIFGQDCLENACDPKTGKCSPKPAKAGAACDDGKLCTDKDGCDGGSCKGTPKSCDDDNKCTTDTCDVVKGCGHKAKSCNDGNSCTTDQCNPQKGDCDHKPVGDGAACTADDSGCTVGEFCEAGTCKAGKNIICKLPAAKCEKPLCQSTSPTSFQCIVLPKDKGAPCDDGDPCTIGSKCNDKGLCSGAGEPLLFHKTIAPKEQDASIAGWFYDVAERPGLGYVAVGAQGSPNASDKATAWWVRLTNYSGVQTGADIVVNVPGKSESNQQSHIEVGARVVLPVPAGGFLVAGTTNSKNGGLNMALYRHKATGAIVSAQAYGAPLPSDEAARDMVMHADGGVTVVGYKQADLDRQMRALRLSVSGALTWQVDLGGKGVDQGHTVALSDDGGTVVGGSNGSVGAGTRAWLVRLGPTGKVLWDKTYGDGSTQVIHGIAALPSGLFGVAGSATVAGKPHSWSAYIDGAGKVVGSAIAPGISISYSVVADVAGGVVAAGMSDNSGLDPDMLVVRFDAVGNPHWDKSYNGGPVDVAYRARRASDGSLLVVGQTRVKQAAGKAPAALSRGLFRHSDPWGHTTCSSAGVCMGKKAAACDDGKPCTLDNCNGKTGCIHIVANGFACDPGKGCATEGACKAGQCAPADNGLYYQKTVASDKETEFSSLIANGGALMTAHATDNDIQGKPELKDKPRWHLTKRDLQGKPLWQTSWNPWVKEAGTFDIGAIAAYKDGSTLVAGRTCGWYKKGSDGPNLGYHLLASKVSADGKKLWSTTYTLITSPAHIGTSAVDVRDMVVREDGHALLVANSMVEAGCPGFTPANFYGYANKPRPFLLRLDNNGKYSGRVWGGEKLCGGLQAALWSDDVALVVGSACSASGRHAAVYRAPTPLNGNDYQGLTPQVAVHTLGLPKSASHRYVDLVRTTDGTLVAVAVVDEGKLTQRMAVSVIDSFLKTKWSKVYPAATWRLPKSLAALPGGDVLVGGHAKVQGAEQPSLMRLSAEGTEIWSRTYPVGKAGKVVSRGLVPLADGGFVLAGTTETNAGWKPMLVRTDPWGHGSCASSSMCSQKTKSSCDDGKACTAGVCEAATGSCKQVKVTGPPCDDGQPCSVSDRCVAGTCKPAGDKLAPVHLQPAKLSVVKTVNARSDGDFYVTSAVDTGVSTKRLIRVMRVRPGGEIVWTSTSDAAIYTFGYLNCAVGAKDELFVLDVSDDLNDKTTGLPTLIYRYDPATGARSKLDYKYYTYTMFPHWHGLEMMAGGKHLGLMWNWNKPPYQFATVGVQKIDLDGKKVWEKSVEVAAPACKPSCPHGAKFPYKSKDGEALKNGFEWPIHGALAATTDGGLVVLATGQFDTSAGKIHRSVVARLNQLGTQKWAAAPHGWRNVDLRDVQQLKDGTIVAVGQAHMWKNEGSRHWMIRFDDKGKILWEKETRRPGDSAMGLIALADGGFAYGGTRVVDSIVKPWLARHSAGGQLLWERVLDETALVSNTDLSYNVPHWQRQKRALAQTKDGTIVFAASTKKGADALVTVASFDLWGNKSCAEAGSCESAKASNCDDKDPCTVDRCTAKSGCKYTAHAEGALCGLNSYCVAGKCTKAPQDMAFVPKGKFWMGCSAKDGSCKSSEKPQHEVVLSSYWIDMYEVTVSDWGKCKAAGKCSNPKGTYSSCNWGKSGREQHPINCIDWSQARGYCQWLGAEFDLPTEAQWEKAARGGCEHNGGGAGCKSGMQTYPWGEASPTCDVAVFSSDGKGCGKDSTWAVGSKPKGVSPYGAHDMSGNVWEWALDWHADDFYSKSSKNDPVNNQSASDRVGRGGSWDGPADYLRAGGYRLGFYPGHDWPDLGFRCAR